jgi:hypothetical protein
VLNKPLVKKVKTRSLFGGITQIQFSPRETDGGFAVVPRDDLDDSAYRGFDR